MLPASGVAAQHVVQVQVQVQVLVLVSVSVSVRVPTPWCRRRTTLGSCAAALKHTS